MTEQLKLRVSEAHYSDVGKSIARIPYKAFKQLNITPGTPITINGRRETTAIAWPLTKTDENKNIIRIDGNIRTNAGAKLDEYVTIRKAKTIAATEVRMAPTGKYILRGAEAYFKRELNGRPISIGDKIRVESLGRVIEYIVINTIPAADTVLVTKDTAIILEEDPVQDEKMKKSTKTIPKVSYEDIGGLDDVIQRLREMIELPMRYPELFRHLGIEPPKGVLMYGPPGTGKTMLAKAVANESQAHFIHVSGPVILSKYFGESEEKLRQIFDEAKKNSPSIIFIDEIDSIAPRRDELGNETEIRVVAQLLALLDGLESRGEVIVIGATNRPNAVDPALRRPGRFDREVEIGVPNKEARFEILSIHLRSMPLDDDVDIEKLASITHGYVGADLAALAKEAAMRSIRRVLPQINWELDYIPTSILEKIKVKMSDFLDAMAEIRPSAMREVYIEIPDVQWECVGGLEDVKQKLEQAVEWPLKYRELYQYGNIKPPKGILLFGPPGTGKTLIIKALAKKTQINFISIKGTEILSKWVGESERIIRELFRKAKQAAPAILFIDDIDSILSTRTATTTSEVSNRIISTFLTELDGLEELQDVIIIGATNRPDLLDPALLRAGRFEQHIYLPLPDKKARKEIISIHLKDKPVEKNISLEKLTEASEGLSGADIEIAIRNAVMKVLQDIFLKYKSQQPSQSLKKLLDMEKPKVTEDLIISYLKALQKQKINEYQPFIEVCKKFLSE